MWTHLVGDNRKTLLIIQECGSKLTKNSVFDCHLSPVGRQMAIENSVSNDFLSKFVDSIDIFDRENYATNGNWKLCF